MSSRPSNAAPILAVLAIVLVTLAAYVAGYFCLGEPYPVYSPQFIGDQITIVVPDTDIPSGTRRIFANPWAVTLFYPAARIEGAITGQHVQLQQRQPD